MCDCSFASFDPGPIFSVGLESECEASRRYQRALREASPKLPDIGELPDDWALLDADPLEEFQATSQGFFGYPERDVEEVSFWAYRGEKVWGQLLDQQVFRTPALVPDGLGNVVVRLLDGAVRFTPNGMQQALPFPAIRAITLSSEGFVGILNGSAVVSVSPEGVITRQHRLPTFEESAYILLALRNGHYVVALESRVGEATPLVMLRRGPSSELEVAWQIGISGRLVSLAEGPGAGVAFGALKPPFYGSRPESSAPFFGLVSADGELLWQWSPEAPQTTGTDLRVVADTNNVYCVDTEDPVSRSLEAVRKFTPSPQQELRDVDGTCSVYGCAGLVVRSFDEGGHIDWEFHHRSGASAARGVALIHDRLWVFGTLYEETHQPVVVGFEL